MAHQFRKHYTRDEARELLPRIREWLKELTALRERQQRYDQQIGSLLNAGHDAGGNTVNRFVSTLCDIRRLLGEFHQRGIQIKHIDRGLVDFPAIRGGREVFLCWELDEDDIEYWHDLETGYAGRERL